MFLFQVDFIISDFSPVYICFIKMGHTVHHLKNKLPLKYFLKVIHAQDVEF